jgi:hypothetical protein
MSALNAQRSALNAQQTALNAQQSALTAQQSALTSSMLPQYNRVSMFTPLLISKIIDSVTTALDGLEEVDVAIIINLVFQFAKIHETVHAAGATEVGAEGTAPELATVVAEGTAPIDEYYYVDHKLHRGGEKDIKISIRNLMLLIGYVGFALIFGLFYGIATLPQPRSSTG